ncbi:hypothetical protein BZA05DRAFT_38003 [Tricharina praecox]|uniref:uncharacterized protein n=1 Tax=Tricharina praecox TaxID=43433 RepID=UPI00221E43B6|nr:uncharacterized protein BZA05DRAFT_38003 [Tricharina praecox]KAI5852180.1 hypothetical protein BZA05DRAFT_38003 [Tricharina praecox]
MWLRELRLLRKGRWELRLFCSVLFCSSLLSSLGTDGLWAVGSDWRIAVWTTDCPAGRGGCESIEVCTVLQGRYRWCGMVWQVWYGEEGMGGGEGSASGRYDYDDGI